LQGWVGAHWLHTLALGWASPTDAACLASPLVVLLSA
jgi:hypothetical protein